MTRKALWGALAGLGVLALLLSPLPDLAAQGAPGSAGLDFDAVRAAEQWRDGVRAFHAGLYNRAVVSFERSLAFKPQETLPRFWLGQALYFSGFEEAALKEWEALVQGSDPDPVLAAWVDTLRQRRSLISELRPRDRLVPVAEILGRAPGAERAQFLRPTGLRPQADGSYWLTGFGAGDVVRLNLNGRVVQRLAGPLEGFLGPYDILPLGNDRFWVTEFRGNRIVELDSFGLVQRSFGGRGRNLGQLLGPQYLVPDGEGAVFISDYGNARVQKWNLNGEALLEIGRPGPFFEGLREPTGLAYHGGRVFIADRVLKHVFSFDASGNYEDRSSHPDWTGPEGLWIAPDGRQYLADGRRIWVRPSPSEPWAPLDSEWEQGRRLSFAAEDANGQLLVADFDQSQVRVMTEAQALAGGLVPRIGRILADEFPNVRLEVSVEDRFGRPVLGLESSNFLLYESGRQVVPLTMEWVGQVSRVVQAAVLTERPAGGTQESFAGMAAALASALEAQGGAWWYGLEARPVLKTTRTREPRVAATLPAQAPAPVSGAFDATLRLAAGQLLSGSTRRALFYLTDGRLPTGAFSTYDLLETAAFLRNNNILFVPLMTGRQSLAPELDYLARETGARAFSWAEAQTFQNLLERLLGVPSGQYVLSYRSITPPELGLRYIPVDVEISLFRRTGRLGSGYFAPLQN